MERSIPWKRLISEFVVIVVGVLVALAADRWREGRVMASQRLEYLDNLILDLEADQEAFDLSSSLAPPRADLVLRAARGLDPKPDSAVVLLYSIEALQWYNPPVVSRETYDDLVSTGNLVILDPALRRVLGQYYDRVTLYERRETLFADLLVNGYRQVPPRTLGPNLHSELFDRIQRERELGREIPYDWEVPLDSVSAVLNRLRAYPEIEFRVGERLYVSRQHAEIYGSRLFGMAKELHGMLVRIRSGLLKPEDAAFPGEVTAT